MSGGSLGYLSILVSTALAVLGAWTMSASRAAKLATGLLALAAGVLSLGILNRSLEDVAAAEARSAELQASITRTEREISNQSPLIEATRLTVGDLASLDKLSGGATYFVRIAADTDRARLEPYLTRIRNQFKGAEASGHVVIREPVAGSKLYLLVFGQHLGVAAAEVYQRLATAHRLPPEGQVAAIVPE